MAGRENIWKEKIMADGIKYVGTRQHLYDDPPKFPNGKVDHWKQFVQKSEKLDKLEKDHTNKLANKIVDKSYKNTKNKNPFTQVAENAAKELSFTLRDGHIENKAGSARLNSVKEAIEINEALDENFNDQKKDDYIKKLKHFGIENSQTKHPDYPKVSNPPIFRNNINNPKITNPTVNKYKTFKDNKKKELEDKKFNEQFEKEYGDKAIEDRLRARELKNKKEGRAPQADFTSSEQIVAEHAKDKARKKLAAIKEVPIKLGSTYIDYRLALKDPVPTISLEEHMAKAAPREIDPLGITGLAEVRDYKRSFDTTNKQFNLRSSNGVGELLGEYDES